jgi:hypothetical protein
LSTGLTDIKTAALVSNYQSVGRYFISQGEYCEAQPSFDNVIGTIQVAGGGVNEYNIRVIGEYNNTALNNYLNQANTKTLIHVPTTVTY